MNQLREIFGHPLLKWSLLFGLATGLLCFLYFIGLYLVGVTPLGNHKVLDFGIHIIMMLAAVWYYRKKVGNGYLHLWEGLTICYVVNTMAAMVTGWLIYLFIEWVDPTVFTRYITEMRTLIVSTKGQLIKELGQSKYQEILSGVANIRPADLITDELSKKTVLAVLPVLIISLAFRRQEHTPLRS